MRRTVVGSAESRRLLLRHVRPGAHADDLEGLIALEVEATYYKWSEARQKIKTLEPSIPLAQKIAANVQGRFDNGNATGNPRRRSSSGRRAAFVPASSDGFASALR